MLGTGVLAALALSAGSASAEQVFAVSGRVGLADGAVPSGTTVRLKLDLDRDGEFSSFETLSGKVDDSGTYSLSYDLDPSDVDFEFIEFVAGLLIEYEARGFEALIDQGPLPAVMSFEREGYSTVTKRLTTLLEDPEIDAMLAPLSSIACTSEGCRTANGGVFLGDFPGGTGIARAYAETYDPLANQPRFPGSFSDSKGNLLISSGFTEIDLRDAQGKKVTKVSSPVSVRYQAKPGAWHTLRDLEPGSGKIEVPMYSFDETIAEWVAEKDGVLETDSGQPIPEPALESIKDGSYDGAVMIAFETVHFSTFNCDAPVEKRSCVKGRLVDELGNPLPGLTASVSGISYTGSAGSMLTGLDGTFASDLMKSEGTSEDVDGNGRRGETFAAQVVVSGSVGLFVGESFDTPSGEASIGGSTPDCKPADCPCEDLGDVVVTFETPRACEVSVQATFSGFALLGAAPVDEGDAIADLKVRGTLSGATSVPPSASLAVCDGVKCYAGTTDAEGTTTFVVPVVGDEPHLEIGAELSVNGEGDVNYYAGTLTVAACARDEASVAVDLPLDYFGGMQDLSGYIAALGPGSSSSSSGGFDGPDFPESPSSGCGCRASTQESPRSAWLFGLSWVLGLALRRRARRS
jgi:MYXO-CTERM domain-containing protein